MAERRMFTKKITESDAFLDMPLSTQALYFHINMAADDEGFVNNPKKIQRMIGASEDDLKLLIAKNFLIRYESGVIVIKHWRMHNYIQKDRFHPTVYQEERQTLTIKENGAYTIPLNEMDTTCIQNVSNLDTEVRLGKDSIGKDSIGKDSIEKNICSEVIAYLNQVLGSHYTTKNKTNVSNINARISEGHTFDDFKVVIDKKYAQWHNDPKMSAYLRPETLFCSKHFESYLNEIVEVRTEKPAPKTDIISDVPKSTYNRIHNFSSERQIDYAELERLAGVRH